MLALCCLKLVNEYLGYFYIVTNVCRMAQFIKNLITMGALLTNTKDFRDLFEDIVTKVG